ncbi:hypothetical protein RD110_24595 [Rhodoferax koreense]|uniref:SURF1-like protein n=1 Tax=Rhodoferax koreensis TaxID=1842727 RepID=A0A1P8K1W1_9BURK|nr:SURF1 family protein [Rhodoferax koreense]APW39990.1 hypothetical protein RD110_24595 [Rhodoferax koreense]
MASTSVSSRRPRSKAAAFFIALAGAMLFASFVSLGTWQVERRAWKHELVARVEQRVHAPAVPAPGRDAWSRINAADDEYRHVALAGRFAHDKETLVQAVTARGSGFWVLTPLQMADGGSVLVNRGFVPPELADRATRRSGEPAGDVSLTGLLRITEPGGGFLRDNDPAGNRWFSRDVAAIAKARGLNDVAPYFVDAAAVPQAAPTEPVGGLTVVAFPDHHLVYALTWYALALMIVGGAWRFIRADRRPG